MSPTKNKVSFDLFGIFFDLVGVLFDLVDLFELVDLLIVKIFLLLNW